MNTATLRLLDITMQAIAALQESAAESGDLPSEVKSNLSTLWVDLFFLKYPPKNEPQPAPVVAPVEFVVTDCPF